MEEVDKRVRRQLRENGEDCRKRQLIGNVIEIVKHWSKDVVNVKQNWRSSVKTTDTVRVCNGR